MPPKLRALTQPDGSLEAVPRLRPAPTLAVLGLALGMRLLVVWTVLTKYPARWVFTRGEEMGLLAVSLLHGQGLGSPFRVPTGPTAFLAPVYPILVAGVFRVFGVYSTASAVFVMCAQSAVNLLTIYLMMRIARRLFSQTAATVAGLIWAVSFPLVWMPTIFWETSLSCCLLSGLLAMVLRLRELPRMRALHWMGLGAYCGLAALVNPALLLALVAVSLWLVFQRRGNAGAAPLLAALAFAVVFAPWPIRNARVFHAFIPLRTTVGFELWMGNHPGSTGFLDETLFPTFNAAELADYKARGEVAYTDRKAALAKEYIRENPGRFALLTAIRTVRFWSGTGSHPGSAIFAAHALFTTVLGFCGLWLLARSRRYGLAILFALPMAVFPLPYMMTHAEFRYRLVLDPVMTLCAGYAAAEIFRRMQVPASGSAPAAAGVGREATTAIGGECIAGRTG